MTSIITLSVNIVLELSMNITLLIWLDMETFTLVVPLGKSGTVSEPVVLLVTVSFRNQVYLSGSDPLGDKTENMYLSPVSPFMLTLIPSTRAGSEKWQINYIRFILSYSEHISRRHNMLAHFFQL